MEHANEAAAWNQCADIRIRCRGILDSRIQFSPAGRYRDITAYVHNVTDKLEIKNIFYGANP